MIIPITVEITVKVNGSEVQNITQNEAPKSESMSLLEKAKLTPSFPSPKSNTNGKKTREYTQFTQEMDEDILENGRVRFQQESLAKKYGLNFYQIRDRYYKLIGKSAKSTKSKVLRKPFSNEDDELIISMMNAGKSTKEIADRLKRPLQSIVSRIDSATFIKKKMNKDTDGDIIDVIAKTDFPPEAFTDPAGTGSI